MKLKRIMVCLMALALFCTGIVSLSGCSGSEKLAIGICVTEEHPALNLATEGFKAALSEKLEADGVVFKFIEQNAQGNSDTCNTIMTQFVSDGVDLIMANATPALQAGVSATNKIPVLATSITDYATALGMTDGWTGKTGTNVSGTTDLAPLQGQADMVKELFPDAKKVGIIYCSAEANSKYQVETITPMLEALGYTVTAYSFSDTNDLQMVTTTAAEASDVIYIPTDNTAAKSTELINSVCQNAGVPIVAGEESICKGCGVATLTISYYDIGYATGEMAYEVLVNGKNPGDMEIQSAPQFTKKYDAARCEALNITVPDGYEAIEAE